MHTCGLYGTTKHAPSNLVDRHPPHSRYRGSQVNFREDNMPVAHVAVGVQSAGWTSPHAFDLMVMHTLLGNWNRTQSRYAPIQKIGALSLCMLTSPSEGQGCTPSRRTDPFHLLHNPSAAATATRNLPRRVQARSFATNTWPTTRLTRTPVRRLPSMKSVAHTQSATDTYTLKLSTPLWDSFWCYAQCLDE